MYKRLAIQLAIALECVVLSVYIQFEFMLSG